jgi:hypothetical protein
MQPLRPLRRLRRTLAAVLDAGAPEPGPDQLGVYLPAGSLGGYVTRPPGARIVGVDPGTDDSPATVVVAHRRPDGSIEVDHLGPARPLPAAEVARLAGLTRADGGRKYVAGPGPALTDPGPFVPTGAPR